MRDIIPAGTARAYRLSDGASASVVNLHGSQVVDAWALMTLEQDTSAPGIRMPLPAGSSAHQRRSAGACRRWGRNRPATSVTGHLC
ncbi:MAG: DUF1989 domain-containing protein [Actinobacteria bacterium]|nr:DUF1989 domain-containing protein [Actinomycetota bacterium]